MNLMTLPSVQAGLLEGIIITSLVFLAGVGIGLYFLQKNHEKELDKLQKATARDCLDFAAEHYENILRRERIRKESAPPVSDAEEITFKEFAEFKEDHITPMKN